MPLEIYVRHRPSCRRKVLPKLGLTPEQERVYRKCACPKWYSGTLEGRWHPRASLNCTTWKEAEAALEKLGRGEPRVADSVRVGEALAEWIAEFQLDDLAPGTTRQYELVSTRLLAFCQRRRIEALVHLDAVTINKWRTEWSQEKTRQGSGIAKGTSNNRIAALRLFFQFCRRMHWIKENPIDLLKTPRTPFDEIETVTLPVDEKDYYPLLAAIPKYFDGTLPRKNGKRFMKPYGIMSTRPAHLVAITKLMHDTGLRVSDSITFDVDKVQPYGEDGDGVYTTRMRKSRKRSKNSEVTVLIPAELWREIQALPRISPKYVFWDGHTDTECWNTGQIWSHLKKIGEAIGIPGMRAHRLRDSFAVNYLNRGGSMQDLSRLLGHSSIETTEKYYRPFVQSAKDALMARAKTVRATVPGGKIVPIRKRRAG